MGVKSRLKARFRRHANLYPNLYNAQQRYSLLLRSRLNYVHEEDFRALPLLDMSPEAFCIDVGGNRGQSITAIKGVLPNASVVSFEPNPVAHLCLERVARRFAGVTTHNVALGASNSETAMFIPRCRGVIFDQLATTQAPDRANFAETIKGFGYSFVPAGELAFDRIPVQVKALDRFRFAPEFIKIDVEGSELEVLEGAETTLRESRPALLIEGGGRTEIERFLSARGYRRCIYAHGVLSLAVDRQALNHFYIHEERMSRPFHRDCSRQAWTSLAAARP
jgi:FkbM family methyltransferase